MVDWLKETNLDTDVAVSTRVRLARNIAKLPFPHVIRGTARADAVLEAAQQAFLQPGTDLKLVKMQDLSPLEKRRYVEKHILSPELTEYRDGACILSPDESICVMIMEEDHFRLQCLKSGFDPQTTLQVAAELDKMLSKHVEYAFDKELGYLTSCPTNVGTGMRLSVMLHLPALTLSGGISPVLASLGRLGITARGIYGEGSKAQGDLYQISNQITLGISETDIVKNVSNVVRQIINKEREVRKTLYENAPNRVTDKVMRSLGILRHASMMDSQEALAHLSMVNMGIGLGIIKDLTSAEVYGLMIDIMPGMLTKEGMSQEERDLRRAEVIQNEIVR